MKYLLVFIGIISLGFIWCVNPELNAQTLIEIAICLNCFFWSGVLEIRDEINKK